MQDQDGQKQQLKYINEKDLVDLYRRYTSPGETMECTSTTNWCSAPANNAYLSRHNQVAKIVYSELSLKHNLLENSLPYYARKYQTEAIL